MTNTLQFTALAVLCGLSIPQLGAQGSLKVFLLAGQSNMEGQAYTHDSADTANWNITTMEFLLSETSAATTYLANMPHTFKGSLNSSWLNPRPDAWCVHYDSSNGSMKEVQPTNDPFDNFVGFGPLGPGFGVNTNFGSMIGAELGMGIRIGDATTDPVFLFKSDKGGTTLADDWRPPSAVARGGVVGPHFTKTVDLFSQFLDDLDSDLLDDGVLNNSIYPAEDPMFGDATSYEVCGFVWLQGFNEVVENGGYFIPEYEENLVDLIHDIRSSDERIPANLPCIIIESSDQDAGLNSGRVNAVATVNAEIPGSAVFFETEDMINGNPGSVNWGNNGLGAPFSTGWGFHFHARAENFLEIGWIMGGAVLDNSYLTSSPFWVDRPAVTSIAFNQAGVSTKVNEAVETVTVYWGTNDPGPTASGWIGGGSAVLGAQAAGAITHTLTGLNEDTTYFFRFHATSTAPATDFWSAPNTFTTPLENPVPELSDPVVAGVFAGGATVEATLRLASADVTLVWAFVDQGESDIATWTSAPGGNSQAFPGQLQDDLVVHDITGLDPNTSYAFRFFATNPNGSAWSAAGNFTIPRDGVSLTAYYDFEDDGDPYDDPAGAFADDLVGLYNPVLVADSPGAFAGTRSASFDGNSALFTDAFTTDLGPDPNSYTIMFWIKGTDADQENNNTRLMTTGIPPNGGNVPGLYWQVEGFGNNGDNGDKMNVRLQNNGLGKNWFMPNATNALANTGETAAWHHVVYLFSNTGADTDGGAYGRTFVDGVQVGATLYPDSVYDGVTIGNTGGQLIIGGHAENAGNRAFTGLLDDVALFAGVVVDADIAAIATGTLSPADFLPADGIVITRVEVVGTNLEIDFTGAAGVDYKLTESADIDGGFVDTAPLVEGNGSGTMVWPMAAATRKFARVEEK